MKFHYEVVNEWPYFAWLATISESHQVLVRHGSEVETNDAFFCEAVWDGEFVQGNFDGTDIVFGSGARIRENKITFVTSCATLDRLQHCITSDNTIVISNSLVCLLSYLDETLDPTYKDFYSDFLSVAKGIHKYKKCMQTLNGRQINFTYYQNLSWDGSCLTTSEKKEKNKDFVCFDDYYRFMRGSLQEIFNNAADD